MKPRGPQRDRGPQQARGPRKPGDRPRGPGNPGAFASRGAPSERTSRGPSSDRKPSGFSSRGPSSDRKPSGFSSRGLSSDRKPSHAPSSDRKPSSLKARGAADRGGFKSNPSRDRGGFKSKSAAPRGGFASARGERDFTGDAPRPAKRPPRPEIRPMSTDTKVVFPAPSPARIGDWLFTTRPEAELDLQEELALQDPDAPLARIAGPALVAVSRKPKAELAFARQGFPVSAIVPADHPNVVDRLADAMIDALPLSQGRAARARGPQKFAVDAWVPDDDRTNPDSAKAQALGEAVRAAIARRTSSWSPLLVSDARDALADNGIYGQLCVVDGQVYLGALAARDAQSVAPGGRLRVHLPQHAPSRAAAKLLEAFAWLDRAPAAGEMCVDLGAAPGGWTWVLLERGAKVLAIDPGKLDALVAKKKGLTHLRADAFKFEPEEPVDWLVADMAWRPLEAAALYGKWARRGWARLLVANIKLPMRKKAEYLVRVRDILETSGWTHLRVRQLYHDREEVTVAAVRL